MGHTHVLRGKCRPAGMILPRLEHRFVGATFSLSSAVALTILSSITSGMIALTGIVFSLAFVMVQFSAVAYSPWLVHGFPAIRSSGIR